ncbi:DNA-binding transcriptional MocR family regulator [Paracidovorax wautersii]|uniref:DNA-binding transcriptional MocR family regulator n=1 Tax=Paracidovorax wautersii TaxID=1177982 RepID=A0ABU1IDN5_9BURK|nr:DNA-binding transcriptional MocR family regulator [Paracidovorax wautersii]
MTSATASLPPARTPAFPSKLPQVGTTIFTVMSQLAAEHGAVNLGQGFPDFQCDPALVDAVTQAMQAGHNQYPPMAGVPALRQAVAGKIEALHGRAYDANTEITITAGATQAILTAILATVQPGDEVVVLEPCYDSYVPNIELAGGTVVRVPAHAGHVPSGLRQDRSGPHAPHAAADHQHAAQPQRHRLDGRGHARAGRTARPDRCTAGQRRGV